MSKQRKLLLSLFSALLLTNSLSAHASHRKGAFFVTLNDGYTFFASKRGMQNNSTPGFQFGYDFSDQWAAELGVSLINTHTTNAKGHTHAHGFIYSLDGIYRTQMHDHFAPYFLAGLGVTGLKPNYSNPVNQAHAEVGVGSQYFISDSIALGAEAKDLYTFSGGKNDVQLLASISFLFGGSSSALNYGVWNKGKDVNHVVA